jgi:hypothetical protein
MRVLALLALCVAASPAHASPLVGGAAPVADAATHPGALAAATFCVQQLSPSLALRRVIHATEQIVAGTRHWQRSSSKQRSEP